MVQLPTEFPFAAYPRKPHSTIADEEVLISTSAAYNLSVTIYPMRLSAERKRALAIIMRQKRNEMQALLSLLLEDARVELNVTTSSRGQLPVDTTEDLPEE